MKVRPFDQPARGPSQQRQQQPRVSINGISAFLRLPRRGWECERESRKPIVKLLARLTRRVPRTRVARSSRR